ncbi:MAG: AAA family ATPase, partial [Dissulfurispiraceae bacterium]
MSKAAYTSIAKISRPKVPGVLLRTKLFVKIDESRAKPVIWVSAPAGSGKTTLIASYLDSRKLPCLWYTVDTRDADPATFFYYMGLAQQEKVSGKNKSLPLLTPEYVAGIKTFTRRYFTKLFTSLTVPHAIVFDNYQDVSLYAPFHEILAEGLLLIPRGSTVIVLSRNE